MISLIWQIYLILGVVFGIGMFLFALGEDYFLGLGHGGYNYKNPIIWGYCILCMIPGFNLYILWMLVVPKRTRIAISLYVAIYWKRKRIQLSRFFGR